MEGQAPWPEQAAAISLAQEAQSWNKCKAAIWRANNPDKVKAYHKKKLTPEELEARRAYGRQYYNDHKPASVERRPKVSNAKVKAAERHAAFKENYPAKYRQRFRNGEASKCKRQAIEDIAAAHEPAYIMSEYLVLKLQDYQPEIIELDTCKL